MSFSDSLDPKKFIIIKGAAVHNLKKLDVAIPRNHFVVITGLSGSGKSSLAFDTLYAEGQRRYVESLSSYARQFLGRIDKPEVDYIKGISPAVAIEQKVNTRNPRSTVGTSTEIYDYLKLLYARIGKKFSPIYGGQVKRDTVTDVVAYIKTLPAQSRILILSPLKSTGEKSFKKQLELLSQQGFTRVLYQGEVKKIEDFLETKFSEKSHIYIVIDRVTVKHDDEDTENRISDSVQTAFYEGGGDCMIQLITEDTAPQKVEMNEPATKTKATKSKTKRVEASAGQQSASIKTSANEGLITFSNRFELDGITFEEPNTHFFSFNNPI